MQQLVDQNWIKIGSKVDQKWIKTGSKVNQKLIKSSPKIGHRIKLIGILDEITEIM